MSLQSWQHRLRPLLAPVGLAWSGAMRARREFFESGRLLRHTPPRPVVSVGNIRLGGSGKTPLTLWLIRWAIGRGLKPVVLTRGYRARPPRLPFLVRPDSPAPEAGDEPLMLARACPEACILVDPCRVRAAIWAMERLSPDRFIQDDGVQHLAVNRQADLVLLAPGDLDEDWNRVFPSGMWREGRSALGSATAFLVKAGPAEFRGLAPLLEKRLARYGRPVFPMELRPSALRGVAGKFEGKAVSGLGGRPYVLATAVADPAGVARTAAAFLGMSAGHLALTDHAPLDSGQRAQLLKLAENANAQDIVCTAKDAVKLRPHAGEFHPRRMWIMEAEPAFSPGVGFAGTFADFWEALWPSLARV